MNTWILKKFGARKYFYIFLMLLLLGAIFRLYALARVPPSGSLDEVSLGYNAYSILKTGRDEYGYHLPVLLRAYDDWRPALYVYIVVPFVQIFGLSVFAVRLPSVICSIFVLIFSYFIGKEISTSINVKKPAISIVVGLLTMAILAISPWHIYISRLGHEVNLALLFTILGVYLSLIWSRLQKPKHLLVSLCFLSLAFISYQSQKIVVPLYIAIFLILHYRQLMKQWKTVGVSLLCACIIALPTLIALASPEGMLRFSGTNVFTSEHPMLMESQASYSKAQAEKNIFNRAIYNKYVAGARVFVSQYLAHTNPTWLFMGQEKENHKVPWMGLMYTWEFPFLILGLWLLLRNDKKQKSAALILSLLAISIIPAAITTQVPHAMRIYTVQPWLEVCTALGVIQGFLQLKKPIYKKVGITVGMLIFAVSAGVLTQRYFVDFPRFHSGSFQYSLQNALAYSQKIDSSYDKVIVSGQDNLSQSYMFYLFNTKYDPSKYILNGGTKSGGFAQEHVIGKYEFRPLNVVGDRKKENTLLIGNATELASFQPLETFDNLDGTNAIRIVESW